MGGSAFAHHCPPYFTPRLPRAVYQHVLKQSKELLGRFYRHVAAPIDAPGKETFGDIDLLVCEPILSDLDETITSRESVALTLARILAAEAHIVRKGDPVLLFAVPLRQVDHADLTHLPAASFVQIDIQTCASHQALIFSHFCESHGDMWSILGTIINPYGLRIDNRGLYIRIAAIEALHKKRSLVLLSSNPVEILNFLGLDTKKWESEMDSLNEMFEYIASCRMFSLPTSRAEMPHDCITSNLQKLKRSERVRYAKRPVFTAWIDEFIPQCLSRGLYPPSDPPLTREQVKQEAFETFGVKEEFEEKELVWILERHREEILKEGLKSNVPIDGVNPALRASSIRVLKEVIIDGLPWVDGNLPLDVQKDAKGFQDIEKIRRWVDAHWREAGEIGFERQRAKCNENAQKVLEKKNEKPAQAQ